MQRQHVTACPPKDQSYEPSAAAITTTQPVIVQPVTPVTAPLPNLNSDNINSNNNNIDDVYDLKTITNPNMGGNSYNNNSITVYIYHYFQ